MQIVQSPKSMAIYMEDDHAGGGNRIIYIDNRPHLPSNIRTFLGDSRAHWEGNALVVETTNFAQGYQGASAENFKMTERFTRVDSQQPAARNHVLRGATARRGQDHGPS